MPVISVLDTSGTVVGELTLSEKVFGAEVKPHLMHEVVLMQLANRRAGTASSKSRGEVSGGGRKPWRQKGTGRARAGSNTSPLWKRGGTIFGPQPRDYTMRVPKKVRRAALRSALSYKLSAGKLLVVRDIPLDGIKTKAMVEVLGNLRVRDGLLVLPGRIEAVEKSSRNIRGITVLKDEGLNVYDVMRHEKLVLLEGAVPKIEGALG